MMKITATVLILSSVLHVKAIPGMFHELINVLGCSDTVKDSYKEYMFALDGEVLMYADYNKGKVVYPQPPFVDPITFIAAYEYALGGQQYCKANLDTIRTALKKPPVKVEPKVRLKSETPPRRGEHTHMLRCSSYDFYPEVILVTWWIGQEPLTSGLSYTDLSDGDWYYQYHSYLEYTPRSGEKITCMVEHPSLTAPIKMDWDDSMPESVKNKVAMGASGLVLGLVLFLSGFIYFQWKKRGRILVPTTNDENL